MTEQRQALQDYMVAAAALEHAEQKLIDQFKNMPSLRAGEKLIVPWDDDRVVQIGLGGVQVHTLYILE